MSYNDGSRLLVFGLSFAQQDSRKMQQVLGHYRKLPDSTNRAVLFAELNTLAKELMSDETRQHDIQAITDWMQNNGVFPALGSAVDAPSLSPSPASASRPDTRVTARRRQHRYGYNSNPLYHYRYGQGRTLSRQLDETNSVEANHIDGHHDEHDRLDEMDTNDTEELVASQNAGHEFRGTGFALEDPAEEASEEAETIVVDDGGHESPVDARSNESDEDISMADGPNEPDGNEMANNIDTNHTEHIHSGENLHETSRSGPEAENEDQIVECPICAEEYPASKFPRRPTITEFCTHPENCCLDCLESSIAAVIERGALHLLACPICPAKLTDHDVKEYASEQVYERYKYLKQQSEIPGHYISCMNPHCGGSQPHDSQDPRMICKYCNFETCAHHKRPWHRGQTCSEFDLDDAQLERLEEEEATAKLLSKESTSICPKCGQGVTKAEGCDHMRCNCGEEWCYICSCSYENVIRHGATAHATFCIYHPNKVNLTKTQQEAARNRLMGLVHGGEVSAELAKARDVLRERRRAEIRPKVAEAAEARRKLALQEKQKSRAMAADNLPRKKKVKLVAPWEEGGRTRKSF